MRLNCGKKQGEQQLIWFTAAAAAAKLPPCGAESARLPKRRRPRDARARRPEGGRPQDPHRDCREVERRRRSARRRDGAARTAQRGARSAVRETPPEVDLFDRGISRGDTPRLWIDAISHVAMGARQAPLPFRAGHPLSAARCWRSSNEIAEIVEAVTHYVAAPHHRARAGAGRGDADPSRLHRRLRTACAPPPAPLARWCRAFMFGLIVGCAALFAALWIVASRLPH